VKTLFLENILKYFVLNIRADSFRPQTVLFSYGYDSATSRSKKILFGENWLNLGKFRWISTKLR